MEAVLQWSKAEGYDDITKYSKYAAFAASDFFGETNTPWMKYIMRDGSKQHKVSIREAAVPSGITPLWYTDELGQVKGTNYERYTYDIGFNADINK